MRTENHEALSTAAMARKLGVSEQTMWKLTRRAGCPAMRIGRVYRWPEAETLDWLRARARASGSTETVGAPGS